MAWSSRKNGFLDLTPGALTGPANQDSWRSQLKKAKEYLKEQAAHEQAIKEGKKVNPPRKPVGDEILSLVKKEIALRIPASRVSEIRELLQLSKELDYKLVISGGVEAWVIPKELAESGASAIITPRTKRQPRFGEEETSGSWIELPRVLEEAGVPFSVQPLGTSISLDGLAGRDLTSLPLEAAFAVRGGASEAKALASITIVPATMMGLQDRIGSIEVGKDADLLILNGPPLDYRSTWKRPSSTESWSTIVLSTRFCRFTKRTRAITWNWLWSQNQRNPKPHRDLGTRLLGITA